MIRLFIVLVLLLPFPTKTDAQNDPLLLICPPDPNYTISSPFKTNLDRLLLNLINSTSTSSALFSNATVGPVYGLAQCRPDVSVADCVSCLNRSVSTFSSRCPLSRSAATRFDLCLLRYSDHPFFSQLANDTSPIIIDINDGPNQSEHDQQVKSLMYKISNEALTSVSRYAADVIHSTQFENIYGMVQCTFDLAAFDCALCLNKAIGFTLTNTSGTVVGAQVSSISCAIRFANYPFFSVSAPPPPPPLPPATRPPGTNSDTRSTVLAAVLSLIVAIGLVSATYLCLQKRRKIRKLVILHELQDDETDFTSGESKWFELNTLRDATDNFANQNKLGQGGFGAVYKGTLKDGQDIAVKRLSASSSQGLQELRNEVVFVAKLQHRNLVTLLGCCLDNNEKLLVYEYLPNSSLDKILFDDNKSQQLDWSSRYKIIEGIARGLLYLHEDSRLRIIHRDLKASNILLDANMDPKISDFGLAKHFGLSETQGNTDRIAGTHGYMAPEYLMLGEFSPKSDVFSYGVLVLEIVTGRKNRGVVRYHPASDLVNNVWKHWNDGKVLELKDRRIREQFPAEQVLRCIHIGLLCVQEDPTKRPGMALVVNMLSSFSTSLPMPLIPGFFSISNCTMESDQHSGNADIQLVERRYSSGSKPQLANLTSVNEISTSDMEPR